MARSRVPALPYIVLTLWLVLFCFALFCLVDMQPHPAEGCFPVPTVCCEAGSDSGSGVDEDEEPDDDEEEGEDEEDEEDEDEEDEEDKVATPFATSQGASSSGAPAAGLGSGPVAMSTGAAGAAPSKRPPAPRKRKPRPVVAPLAPEDDPAVLKAVAPELHAALMKAYDGKRCALHFLELSPGMPRAVWRRALVCSCGCGCGCGRACVVVSSHARHFAPAGLTNKQIKVELKERHAVVGGTRTELLERAKQLMMGTYVIQYVCPPPMHTPGCAITAGCLVVVVSASPSLVVCWGTLRCCFAPGPRARHGPQRLPLPWWTLQASLCY